jgi:haloalkane dehalogenase
MHLFGAIMPSMYFTHIWRQRTLLLLLPLLCVVAGCGEDDNIGGAPPVTSSICTVPAKRTGNAAQIEAASGVVLQHPTYGNILRTPKERFDNLTNYSFASHYVDVDPGDSAPLYMHYLDEGPDNGRVILLLHGNPNWSYLVRDHVAPLVAAGYRVIALDLIGFGKSDKPADRVHHTYANHTVWVENFVKELGLCGVTMHGQDWGGLIGARVAIYQRDKFSGVALSNAGLPDGTIPIEPGFEQWRDVISEQVQNFSLIMEQATPSALSDADIIAYDAPFPSNEYTAGPRQMPKEVPFSPALPQAITNQAALKLWAASDLPLMTVFSDPGDPSITSPNLLPPDQTNLTTLQNQLIQAAPGAAGQVHVNFRPEVTGHFISEDTPDLVTQYLLEFMEKTKKR